MAFIDRISKSGVLKHIVFFFPARCSESDVMILLLLGLLGSGWAPLRGYLTSILAVIPNDYFVDFRALEGRPLYKSLALLVPALDRLFFMGMIV